MRSDAFILLSALALAKGETTVPNGKNCPVDIMEELLYPHNNCNQYYQCVNGKLLTRDCPQNLLFNQETQQCDWSKNVNCQVSEIPDAGGVNNECGGNCDPIQAPAICAAEDSNSILVAHENCNQFYICDNGKPVTMTCNGNLLYNPVKEICDWPDEVSCGDRVTSDSENEGENNISGNEDNENGCGAGNSDPSEAPVICAAEDSDGILVAHEKCNKFYICSLGHPLEVACGANLLFNPTTDQCDWPKNVECGSRVVPDADSDNNNSDNDSINNSDNDDSKGDSENSNGCGCNDDPSEASSICAAENSDGVFVAHENCNKFYICSEQKAVAIRCPLYLLYNPSTEKCDWPENVNCGERILPDENEEDNDSDDNNIGGEGGDNGNGDAPSICAAEGSDGVLVAHEKCNKYYLCASGNPVAFKCGENLLYNPAKEYCDWPENVDCGDRIIPDGEDNDSVDNGDNNSNGDGGDGEGDSDNDNGCNCHDNPGEAPAICAAEDSNNVFVAHENCNKFYICFGGEAIVLNCPLSLLYNPSTGKCDWPDTVECGARVIPGGDNEHNEDDNDNSNNDHDNINNDDNEAIAVAVCAGEGTDGTLLSHGNCKQFYICLNHVALSQTCPATLLFDASSKQCNWPGKVNCDSRVRT